MLTLCASVAYWWPQLPPPPPSAAAAPSATAGSGGDDDDAAVAAPERADADAADADRLWRHIFPNRCMLEVVP